MKIPPVEAELFHADGRTDGRTGGESDMAKLTVKGKVHPCTDTEALYRPYVP